MKKGRKMFENKTEMVPVVGMIFLVFSITLSHAGPGVKFCDSKKLESVEAVG